MKSYLVGGAVRDRLLGKEVTDRGYVVVGASPEEMLALGYRQVGQDFPVFLHPETGEEYALAGAERKQNQQRGEVIADFSVTLEEELGRRDLTINAIAEDESGKLIDPFNGIEDLNSGLLRHVSAAFTDDPLRVLRVARFMARYSDLNFKVAPETKQLIQVMAEQGELNNLIAERVWQELTTALGEVRPERFFECLRDMDVLRYLFPEIDALWGVPQPEIWHPEVDCGTHTMMTLAAASRMSSDLEVRFAALTHDLGKAETSEDILPSHYGHEARGVRLVKQICRRLKAPCGFRDLAERCANYHSHLHRLYELRPKTVLKLLQGLDAFRKPQNLVRFITVCRADFQGRKGFEQRPYPQAKDLIRAYEAALEVVPDEFPKGVFSPLLGETIRRARIARIESVMSSFKGCGKEELSQGTLN